MGSLSLKLVLFSTVFAAFLVGVPARSTGYSTYGYGGKAPPAVAANGSGRYRSASSSYMGGAGEPPKATDQTKASPPQDKKSSGPAMSAWGIIAIILTLCLSLMGIYYFTLFYPILCKKERKYDVMDLGSQ